MKETQSDDFTPTNSLQQGWLGGGFLTFDFTCSAMDKCLLPIKIFCCPVWFYTNISEKPSDTECGAQFFSVIYTLVYLSRQPTYPREQSEYQWEQRSDSWAALACWAAGLNQLLEDDIRKYNLQRDSVQRVLSLLSGLIECSRGTSLFQSSSFGFIFHFFYASFSAKQLPTSAICLSRLLVIILAKKLLFTHMVIPRASNLASKLHCDGCYTDH